MNRLLRGIPLRSGAPLREVLEGLEIVDLHELREVDLERLSQAVERLDSRDGRALLDPLDRAVGEPRPVQVVLAQAALSTKSPDLGP